MENNTDKNMPSKKGMHIADIVILARDTARYLFSKWLTILIAMTIGGILGVTYAWLKKPKYIANISFFTETESNSGMGVYAGIAAQFGFNLGGSGGATAFEGENLIEILRSKTLVTKTLLTPVDNDPHFLMIDKYLSDNLINKKWNTDKKYMRVRFEQFPLTAERLRDSIVDKVYENILASNLLVRKRDKKLDLIDVIMESGNEYFSKRFVELLTDNAIKYYTDYKIKKSSQNVAMLQKQTDSVKGILFGNISQVAEMNDVNVNPLRQVVRTGVQRKQVDLQASSVIYGELVKNLELSKMALRKETPLIQVVDQPTLPLKMVKPGRLLTGIVYAFFAGFFCMIYLIAKQWLRVNNIIGTEKKSNINI